MTARDTIAVGVTIVGVGAIGRPILAAALADERIEVRACVDRRADLAAVAAACGFAGPTCAALEDAPPAAVVALRTSSRVAEIAPLALAALARGHDVVTSCEELIAPELADARAAAELDRVARERGRSVLACGVNPGFCMDLLPLVLTIVTREVEGLRIVRRTDVSRRRRELRDKLGVGCSAAEFAARAQTVGIGHVGLRASIACLARALGWHGEVDETVEPVLDEAGGTALGVRHRASARDRGGRERIQALLEMYAGVEELDEVEIRGVPPLTVRVDRGVAGDEATVSAVLNAIAGIGRLPPGLLTPVDLVPPAWWSARG